MQITQGGRLTIKPYGNWQRAQGFISTLSPTVLGSVMYAQKKFMEDLASRAKNHLKNQDLAWEPLAPSTERTKGHSLILINTYTYQSNIKAWRSGFTYYAGVKRGIYYETEDGTGAEVALVAGLHERGYTTPSGRIPARPLWAPSIQEMGGMEGIRGATVETVVRNLQLKNVSEFIIKKVARRF